MNTFYRGVKIAHARLTRFVSMWKRLSNIALGLQHHLFGGVGRGGVGGGGVVWLNAITTGSPLTRGD